MEDEDDEEEEDEDKGEDMFDKLVRFTFREIPEAQESI